MLLEFVEWLQQNRQPPWMAFSITLVIAVILVQMIKFCVIRGLLSTYAARKVLHITIGPIYLLMWNIFPNEHWSDAVWAALVPALITLYFCLIGFGIVSDSKAVKMMSRSGQPAELLLGPLSYGVWHVIITIAYWRQWAGVVSLLVLCAGDGFAALIGQFANQLVQFRGATLPWNSNKTWIGSMSFIIASCVFIGVFERYNLAGCSPRQIQRFDASALLPTVLIPCFVETISPSNFDNTFVIASSMISMILCGYTAA